MHVCVDMCTPCLLFGFVFIRGWAFLVPAFVMVFMGAVVFLFLVTGKQSTSTCM